MAEKNEDAPPEFGSGADRVVRWTLARCREELAHSRDWVAGLEEEIETAKLFRHEATAAVNALERLVEDQEMYRAGRTREGVVFDADNTDAEIAPETDETLFFAFRPIPVWNLDGLTEEAQADLERVNRTTAVVWGLISLVDGARVEPAIEPHPLAPGWNVDHPTERHNDVKRDFNGLSCATADAHADRALPAIQTLWGAGGEVIAARIAERAGMDINHVYVAIKRLKQRGTIRVERIKEQGAGFKNLVLPPATPGHITASVPAPAEAATQDAAPDPIPDRKILKARELIAAGKTLTAVAGILDVNKRDLYAALHPNVGA